VAPSLIYGPLITGRKLRPTRPGQGQPGLRGRNRVSVFQPLSGAPALRQLLPSFLLQGELTRTKSFTHTSIYSYPNIVKPSPRSCLGTGCRLVQSTTAVTSSIGAMLGLQLWAPQRTLPCNVNTVRNANQPTRSFPAARTKPQESRKGVRCFAEGAFG
jgi:hypothetical protein